MFEAEATDMLLVDRLVFRVIVSAEYAGQKVKMVVKTLINYFTMAESKQWP